MQHLDTVDAFDEESKAAARQRVEADKAESAAKRTTLEQPYDHNKWGTDSDNTAKKVANQFLDFEVRVSCRSIEFGALCAPQFLLICPSEAQS